MPCFFVPSSATWPPIVMCRRLASLRLRDRVVLSKSRLVCLLCEVHSTRKHTAVTTGTPRCKRSHGRQDGSGPEADAVETISVRVWISRVQNESCQPQRQSDALTLVRTTGAPRHYL